MPLASRVALVCVLLLGSLVLGCGGDDDDDNDNHDASPTRTSTASRITATPSPGGSDEKTIGPGESPDGGDETPVDTGTPPPTATSGTPAPRVEDVAAFFAQFPTSPQDERQCAYNPSTRQIDCLDRGLYAPNPPPGGQGIECFLMVANGNPVVIRCEAAEPQDTTYYDIP